MQQTVQQTFNTTNYAARKTIIHLKKKLRTCVDGEVTLVNISVDATLAHRPTRITRRIREGLRSVQYNVEIIIISQERNMYTIC